MVSAKPFDIALGLLQPAVTGRVGSSRWKTAVNDRDLSCPSGINLCSAISFPELHMITHGWFRSRCIKEIISVDGMEEIFNECNKCPDN